MAKKEQAPKVVAITARGISTSRDFAQLMSALISDIAEQRIPAREANAICNAGGRLLKIVELQLKFGGKVPPETAPLMLAEPVA